MHYQIIYYKVISDAPVTVSVSQVRKATGCGEVGDCIDVIAERISFKGECDARKISLWLTNIAQ